LAEQPPQNPTQLPLGGNGTPQNLIPIDIEVEMKKSYLDYAMSVIIGRALPDVRDGLKPVQRRILYGMLEAGLRSNRGYRKAAKIVGEVMGNYHPHGDASIYDTLVRMAQPFSMRYPLVDGQGNFGSVDGDMPAAMRYTEARLTALAEVLLQELDQDTVDFRLNYDETTQEPESLPAAIPHLFINGANGIAVGMATNIPPHNLNEMLEAAILLVQNPKTTLQKILEIVKGPDFPTGGIICGTDGIISAYKSGRGHMTVRARADIEPMSKDRKAIVVTEIPYQVNKSRLIEHAAGLVNEKKIEGISDIRDESDRQGMRIVFELKRGEEPEIILNNLYKHTQLQQGFGITLLAIVGGQPRELGLLEYLGLFVEHRIDVVRRRTNYLLRKAREREHLLLGFQKALDHLDEVIKLIRASKSPAEARTALMGAFDFSERQAQAIIELQLQRLTAMERQKIIDELAEIQRRIAEYLEILGSDQVLRKLIIKELREVQKKFKDERRTEITGEASAITLEDLVPDEDMTITVTHNGYLKRTPNDTYRKQSRGGRGRIGMGMRGEDFVEDMFTGSTHSYLLVFTNLGRVYWLKVYNIPDVGTTGKGKHIANLVSLQPDEKVQAFLPVREFTEGRYVLMATKQGVIKKCDLTVFDHPLSRGIIAIALDEGDQLISARLTEGEPEIFLATYQGKAIRFNAEDVRPMGRPARGVRAIRLADGDSVIGMVPVSPGDLMLSVTESGYGKRTELEEYRITNRGGKGVINIKTTKRNGNVVTIMRVRPENELMIITRGGKIIRVGTDEIRATGRSAQGVRLVKLEETDQIAAACVVPAEENGGEDDDGSDGQGVLLQ
jgi:DNA gyrase subunit A